MKMLKDSHEWKTAAIYFCIFMGISILLNLLYSILVVSVLNTIFLQDTLYTKNIYPAIRTTVPFVLFILAIYLSARIMKRKVTGKKRDDITLLATLCYAALELVSFLRSLLIRNINGIPLQRNYLQILITAVITIAIFYFLTKVSFLDSYKTKKTKHQNHKK